MHIHTHTFVCIEYAPPRRTPRDRFPIVSRLLHYVWSLLCLYDVVRRRPIETRSKCKLSAGTFSDAEYDVKYRITRNSFFVSSLLEALRNSREIKRTQYIFNSEHYSNGIRAMFIDAPWATACRFRSIQSRRISRLMSTDSNLTKLKNSTSADQRYIYVYTTCVFNAESDGPLNLYLSNRPKLNT